MFKKDSKTFRILFISPRLPYPLDDGIKIRAFFTINEFLKRGYEVVLLCFVKDAENLDLKELEKIHNLDVVGIPLNESPNITMHLNYAFSRYPFYMKFFYRKDFILERGRLLKTSNFDLVYVYDRAMVLYGQGLKVPKIFDSVDSQSLNSLSGFKSSQTLVNKIYWYLEYLKSKKVEKNMYPLYDAVITAAERDANHLMDLTNLEVTSVPSGVDLDYFKQLNLKKIPYSLVFLGTMDAFSNQQAVLYFVEKVYPAVKQNFPSAKLFVIGRNPPEKISRLDDNENIFVTGYVEDVRSYLDKCEIVISPLKMASGIQTKILVAMAMNKVIVATNESIGEIDKYITERDIVVVDKTEKFTCSILELFSDKDLLREIGRNGRNIIKKNYSWESLGYTIDEIIQRVMAENY